MSPKKRPLLKAKLERVKQKVQSKVGKRAPRKAKATDADVQAPRIRSIPADVVLGPQAEPPRLGTGQDRSRQRQKVRELSWSEFDREVQGLARAIRDAFAPEAVVGVAHGGVFVGGAVASTLGCEFYPVRISRRSRDSARAGPAAGAPKVYGELPAELAGRRVLVVDDIASSGDTLELATQLLRKVGAREVQTAVLVQREGGFTPDHAAFESDGLVVFPWDYDLLLPQDADTDDEEAPRARPAKKAKGKGKGKGLFGGRPRREPSGEEFGV